VNKIKCHHCKEYFNSKMKQCPFCGSNKVENISKDAKCPQCNCLMDQEDYRGAEIDSCPQCNGIWLDTDEFKYLTSERDTYTDNSIPFRYDKRMDTESRGYVPCVRCDRLMSKRNFRRISGVVIDICGDHGVWLDAGELEQIRCFIANGGLDESQDKYILENKEKIADVAREVKDTKSLIKKMHRWNYKRILFSGF